MEVRIVKLIFETDKQTSIEANQYFMQGCPEIAFARLMSHNYAKDLDIEIKEI